jgi:hypothetical protein
MIFTKDKYNGSCLTTKVKYKYNGSCYTTQTIMFVFCKHHWDPKDVRSFLTLLGSHKGLMMTLQGRNM